MPAKGQKKQPDGSWAYPVGEEGRKVITPVSKSDEIAQQSYLDDAIWERLGTMSPKAIADELSVTPSFVAGRMRELLEAVDALTIDQQISQAMVRLNQIAQEAQEAAKHTVDEYKAGMWNSAISAHSKVMDQLTRLKRQNEDALQELNRKRVAEIGRLVQEIVYVFIQDISDEHGLNQADLEEKFQDVMFATAQKLS